MKEVTDLRRGNMKKTVLQPVISAFVTAVCFLFMCIVSDVYPIGQQNILVSDLEAQYAPFLIFWKDHIASVDMSHLVESLTYSFGLGAGKNIMSTFGYYLASPLNLFLVFFDAAHINEYVIFVMTVKLSLASAFMCIFLRSRNEEENRWHILLGILYSFSYYTMAFLFNIMWLDGYALLPLLLYFTEKFLKKGSKGGLIVTLLLLFFTNYYIAYMAGIFAFVYLIVRMIELGTFREGMGKVLFVGGRFVLTAVLCALTLCVILIPVGLDTIRNSDPTSSSSERLVYSTVLSLIDQLFVGDPGEFSEVLPSNQPFIFISLLVTMSTVLFFVSPVFKKGKKKLYAILLAGVYLSVAVMAIDTAWQAFDTPNWFWHRQTFVFMPFFLLITLQVLGKIKEIRTKDLGITTAIVMAALFIDQSIGPMKTKDKPFIFNLCFIPVIFIVLVLMKKEKWHEQLRNMPKLVPALLCILTVFETAAMGTVLSSGVSTLSVHYGIADEYINAIRASQECAEGAELSGYGFRHESEQIDTGARSVFDGSGAYYGGYNGISFFNSSSTKGLHRFFKQLGQSVNYNYFAVGYNFTSPDVDAFLSIGTFTTRRPYKAADYLADDMYGSGLQFYKNRNVLPLAFEVSEGAFDYDFYCLEKETENKNYFDMRSSWYASMFPDAFGEEFYEDIPESLIETEVINGMLFDFDKFDDSECAAVFPEDESYLKDKEEREQKERESSDPDKLGGEVVSDHDDVKTTVRRNNPDLPIVIRKVVKITSDRELYMNISVPRVMDDTNVYINGKRLKGWSAGSFYSAVVRLGSFEPGDEVEVEITSDSDSYTFDSINFSYLDIDSFDSQFKKIDLGKVRTDKVSNGYVSISSSLTEDGCILTTIPYEDGWTLKIDGKKADIKVYQDALIGISCPAGDHTIELSFVSPGLKAGAICSIAGIIGLSVFCILDKKKKKAK